MLSYSSKKIINFFDRDGMLKRVKNDPSFSFAKYTTYGAGGGAVEAFFPRNLTEAYAVYDELTKSRKNVFILAGGSNILASDAGFDGAVICTKNIRGIARINDVTIFCLCGTTVGYLLNYCKMRGLSGLEYLAGIPATVAGLAFMNGGAGGRYIGSDIIAVKLYDGKNSILSNKKSIFTHKHSTMRDIKCLISGVFLSVKASTRGDVEKRIAHYLSKRESLPKGRSCGCVFKNPPGISAGAVIDNCGLAGYGSERAFVSPKHCNFIINRGATAGEIRALIEDVKRIVLSRAGLLLEEEVIYVGNF